MAGAGWPWPSDSGDGRTVRLRNIERIWCGHDCCEQASSTERGSPCPHGVTHPRSASCIVFVPMFFLSGVAGISSAAGHVRGLGNSRDSCLSPFAFSFFFSHPQHAGAHAGDVVSSTAQPPAPVTGKKSPSARPFGRCRSSLEHGLDWFLPYLTGNPRHDDGEPQKAFLVGFLASERPLMGLVVLGRDSSPPSDAGSVSALGGAQRAQQGGGGGVPPPPPKKGTRIEETASGGRGGESIRKVIPSA